MRGTGSLLVHIVNDYLLKELPDVRNDIIGDKSDWVTVGWEDENSKFHNHGNVKIVEYEDDNEYFNIDPEKDVRFTSRTNDRYWEKLSGMSDDDRIGAISKG